MVPDYQQQESSFLSEEDYVVEVAVEERQADAFAKNDTRKK